MSGGRIGSAPPRGPGQVGDRHLLPTRLGRLHVRTLAPGTAAPPGAARPPLLLLHLAPQSSRMWDRVAPLLATDRLVVLPDRIGFGDSDHVERAVPFAEYAAATLDAVDRLAEATGADLSRFDVVGAHTGSCEAVELAVTQTERVRRCGVLALPVLTRAQAETFRGEYQPPREPQLDGSHLLDPWHWWLRWLPAAWGLDLIHQRTLDVLKAEPDAWWAYHSVFDYAFAEALARVTQPLLVLAPRDDLWELTQTGLALCPPQTELVDLPDVTLEGWWRHPDELAGHMRRFLDTP